MTARLTYAEQRGTLSYWAGFSRTELRTMPGHFALALDGRTVVARKVRGRNRWQLCNLDDVESFQPANEVTR